MHGFQPIPLGMHWSPRAGAIVQLEDLRRATDADEGAAEAAQERRERVRAAVRALRWADGSSHSGGGRLCGYRQAG